MMRVVSRCHKKVCLNRELARIVILLLLEDGISFLLLRYVLIAQTVLN